MPDRLFDKLSMSTGVLALIGSGLFFLDHYGSVDVDEVVALAALWVGMALVALVRSGLKLQKRLSAPG